MHLILVPLIMIHLLAVGVAPGLHGQTIAAATAENLVEAAWNRLQRSETHVHSYRLTVRQRSTLWVDVGHNAERLAAQCERAASIKWRVDEPSTMNLLAGRFVTARDLNDVRVPRNECPSYELHILRPSRDPISVALATGDGELARKVKHPLSDRDQYRYWISDTTRIVLDAADTITVLAIGFSPRIPAHGDGLEGMIWLENRSFAIVRVAIRQTGQVRMSPPEGTFFALVRYLIGPADLEVTSASVEYGRFDGVWLPIRTFLEWELSALHATLILRATSSHFFSDHEVELAPNAVRLGDPCDDSRQIPCRCFDVLCWQVDISVPDDTLLLLQSEELPSLLLGSTELDRPRDGDLNFYGTVSDQRDVLRTGVLWPPVVQFPSASGRLLRYNRVEGLSPGIGLRLGPQSRSIELMARIGTADRRLRGKLALGTNSATKTVRIAWYFRRLAVANRDSRALELGNSIAAFIFGVDSGEYFEATGSELRAEVQSDGRGVGVRLFAERQQNVQNATDFYLMRVFRDSVHSVSNNLQADAATQAGIAVRYVENHSRVPVGAGWLLTMDLDAESGTYRFARATGSFRGVMHGRKLSLGAEIAAGATAGETPVQRWWFLGGATTVRGHARPVAAGSLYWRGRLEAGARIAGPLTFTVFGDVGWADVDWHVPERAAVVVASAGIGASLLQGAYRVDLVLAPRNPRMAFHLYRAGML